MFKPRVSIIVPCYGVEKYIDRCMESLIGQTLKEIEIILVDDKSPDNVPAMCDNWAAKDSRVRVIHKNINEGLGYARNSGLEMACGEFVAFVDSDDYVDIDMYRKLYETAQQDSSDAVFCGFKSENNKGEWKCSEEVRVKSMWEGTAVRNFMLDMVACDASVSLERRYSMSVWHAIYSRAIVMCNDLHFLSERDVASEDIPFQVDFLKKCSRVSYLPDNMYYYCNNSTSLTATFKPEKFECFKSLFVVLKQKLNDIPAGDVRASRFFLGYIRSQFQNSLASGNPSKAHINEIVNDSIWVEISRSYPVSSVANLYQRVIYRLILSRSTTLIYLFYKVLARL